MASTALAIRALRVFTIPGGRPEFEARIRRAAHWLALATPVNTEEETFRLLGMVWAGGDARLIRAAVHRLVSQQRTDGGWAQLATLPSDAYATGQVLYALTQADSVIAKCSRIQELCRPNSTGSPLSDGHAA